MDPRLFSHWRFTKDKLSIVLIVQHFRRFRFRRGITATTKKIHTAVNEIGAVTP